MLVLVSKVLVVMCSATGIPAICEILALQAKNMSAAEIHREHLQPAPSE
jgi:hypothetical protein